MGIFKVNNIILNHEESNFMNWVYDIKCSTDNMRQGSCEDKEALRNAIESISDTTESRYIYLDFERGNSITYGRYPWNWRNEYEKERDKFDIKDVIFNNPATIVLWADGTKTVVKAENEEFDPEKGLAMAIAKKALGNNYGYYDTFKKYVGKYEKKQKKGDK